MSAAVVVAVPSDVAEAAHLARPAHAVHLVVAGIETNTRVVGTDRPESRMFDCFVDIGHIEA
jgi:hypothetical protein